MEKGAGWVKTRHKVIVDLLRPTFGLYVRWRYGIQIDPFPQQGDRPYLIVMNHQTAFDQFFVSLTFRRPVYYLASEDIFSMGWLSRLIRYLVAPIPIKKQTTDLQAVKTCIRVAREGGTICLAPEGNRTYHGKTLYIKPGIGSLAKKLGLPIAVYHIENGYGVHPRWSDVVRRGSMRGYVKAVIEPEDYKDMTAQELFAQIQQALTVDEGRVTGEFHHRKNAEFLERAMYVCPRCGLTRYESRGDRITCTRCGDTVRHLPTKELEGVNCRFPHRFVADWYDWQEDYVNHLALNEMTQVPAYTEQVQLFRVYPNSHKSLLHKQLRLCLYGDRITLGETTYPFDRLEAVVVLGKNKLNLYTQEGLFQVRGDKRFNALKYVHFYHRYKNIVAGGEHGEFLGL